ncbi:MAG: type I glyceraldehyde-3-phosphate dehydrogenase [Chloroflexi bacterium]|nr:type I glyceraldehyde-3-phosphate dehydrogenase [Chloroflexota bacterium]
MAVRIALNGFGRIGRQIFKIIWQDFPQMEVVGIGVTDPTVTPTRAILLKYDSTYGVFPPEVEAVVEGKTHALRVDGKEVPIIARDRIEWLPWKDLAVDIVIEATGKYRDPDKAIGHILAGASRVIITAPDKPMGSADFTVVMGINEHRFDPEKHTLISCASCTTNCLAPVAKVLHERFGIEQGLLTTVHAYTTSQQLLDKAHKDPRRARSANLSIIPTTTGAAEALAAVMPELLGKCTGMALRVPVPSVSLVDFTVELTRKATAKEINAAFKEESQGGLKGILGVTDKPLVSVDFVKDPRSAVVDLSLTQTVGRLAKVFAWYDNEWGYSYRVCDLAHYLAQRDPNISPRLTQKEEVLMAARS